MPHPFPLASVFTEGMRRDVGRTMLPGGSVWNLQDFIPDELGFAALGRGGWTYPGGPIATASVIPSIGYHPALGVVVATDGTTAWNAVSGAVLNTGFYGVNAPPAYHRGYLIYGARFQAGIPKDPYAVKDDGTAVDLTGGAPGTIPGVYKDHALLAKQLTTQSPSSTSAHLNRIWFSAAGDPTTWDTNFGWWDTTGPITALASTMNCILIFHGSRTERLRGTTPPPGSDMVLEPFFDDGCIDPFSVANWQERVVFASSRGIYLTDGVSVVDLTAAAQMKSYWSSLLSGYTSSWRIAGGIFRDHYIVSINNGNTLIDCLCVSLANRTMWRFSNVHGSSFANVTDATQERLYMGQQNHTGRVCELSNMWSSDDTVKQDGDGGIPTPTIETGTYRGFDRLHRRWIESMGIQKWRYVYLDYDLHAAAGDTPTISLSYASTPTGAYTTMVGGDAPATTQLGRVRRSIHNATVGAGTRTSTMQFKIAVSGRYSSARLYALEGTFDPIDIGRLK